MLFIETISSTVSRCGKNPVKLISLHKLYCLYKFILFSINDLRYEIDSSVLFLSYNSPINIYI